MTAAIAGAGNADSTKKYPGRAAVVSWIFFDWAAQPYFTLITTFVFAPYFANFVAPNPATGQALWGFAAAAAGLGGHRRCVRPPQSVDRGIRRAAGGRCISDVDREAGR